MQTALSRAAMLTLGALGALGPLTADLYLPGLPSIAAEWGVPAAVAQGSLGACILGLALGQLFWGPLSDRWGRRGPLLAGLLLFGLASGASTAAPDPVSFLAARFVQGLGASAGIVLSLAVVRDSVSGGVMARLLARLLLVSGLAPIAAPLLGGFLLPATGWRGLFLILTVLAAVFLAAAAGTVNESLPAGRRLASGTSVSAALAQEARRPGFLRFALAGGWAIGAGSSYIASAPFVLQDHFGLTPQVFGLVFGANAVGLVAAGQLGAHLVKTRGALSALRSGATVMAAASVPLAAASGSLPVVLAGLFLMIAALGLVLPSSAALALEGAANAGSAAALLGALQFGVAAVASPLAGLFGQPSPFIMACLMAAFALAARLQTR